MLIAFNNGQKHTTMIDFYLELLYKRSLHYGI
jgi:hypothetical protein